MLQQCCVLQQRLSFHIRQIGSQRLKISQYIPCSNDENRPSRAEHLTYSSSSSSTGRFPDHPMSRIFSTSATPESHSARFVLLSEEILLHPSHGKDRCAYSATLPGLRQPEKDHDGAEGGTPVRRWKRRRACARRKHLWYHLQGIGFAFHSLRCIAPSFPEVFKVCPV